MGVKERDVLMQNWVEQTLSHLGCDSLAWKKQKKLKNTKVLEAF